MYWLRATGLDQLFGSFESWLRLVHDETASLGYGCAVVLGWTRFGTYAAARDPSHVECRHFATADEERRAEEQHQQLDTELKRREAQAKRAETQACGGRAAIGQQGELRIETQPLDGEIAVRIIRAARELGIETVYQDLALVPLISIARNFWLGQELTRQIGPLKLLNHREMSDKAREALADIGIRIRSADEPVGSLSGGERQSIAIGRAVYFGKKLLILDEPTSALSVKQTGEVLKYTLAAKERGLSVIFITHNIAHVHEVADRFTIIRGGRKIGDFRKEDVTEMEVAHMVMTGLVPERLQLEPVDA